MMPPSVDRAVVELLADHGVSLGTGFLVSADGLILTAAHVAGNRTTIGVRFADGTEGPAVLTEQGPTDWALFRFTNALPAFAAPVPCGSVDTVAAEVHWYTVGHAKLRGGLRGGFHGVVRRNAGRLELYCRELDGQTYENARGLSGAPCVVDGEAVGLIVDVLHRNAGDIVAGEVSAIPLESIVPRNATVTFSPGPALPWEDVITAALERLVPAERRIAADAAELRNPVESPRLARQIARRMINQGVLGVAAVLRALSESIEPRLAENVLSVAETLWVTGTAAESMAAFVEGQAVAHLETELDWSARHHFERAYASRRLGRIAWKHVLVAPSSTREPFADAVVEETWTRLEKELKEPDRAKIRRRLALPQYAGATAFIASPPRRDVVERLRAELPQLAIVFMSRAQQSSGGPAAIGSVVPIPTESDEETANTNIEVARALL